MTLFLEILALAVFIFKSTCGEEQSLDSIGLASSPRGYQDDNRILQKIQPKTDNQHRIQPKSVGKPSSCLDYLKAGFTESGVYTMDQGNNSFPMYCDMKSEPGNAWALVISFNLKYRSKFAFSSFKVDNPVNENAPNFDLYRLTLVHMQAIKGVSTQWRSTCSFPTHGVDYRDYVRGNFKDFDIMTYNREDGSCKKVEYVNVRGHVGVQTTAPWYQKHGPLKYNPHFLHIQSSERKCGFVAAAGAKDSEDNFGYYKTINPDFRCTANNESTTQWWFGGHI